MSSQPSTAHQSQSFPRYYRQRKASSSQKTHHTGVSPGSQSLASRSLIKSVQHQLSKLYFNGKSKTLLSRSISGLLLWVEGSGPPCLCEKPEGMQCTKLCWWRATTPQSPQGNRSQWVLGLWSPIRIRPVNVPFTGL